MLDTRGDRKPVQDISHVSWDVEETRKAGNEPGWLQSSRLTGGKIVVPSGDQLIASCSSWCDSRWSLGLWQWNRRGEQSSNIGSQPLQVIVRGYYWLTVLKSELVWGGFCYGDDSRGWGSGMHNPTAMLQVPFLFNSCFTSSKVLKIKLPAESQLKRFNPVLFWSSVFCSRLHIFILSSVLPFSFVALVFRDFCLCM